VLLPVWTLKTAENDGIKGARRDFTYYVLALSWSPSYCADEGRGRGEPQCSGARPYAFVLHGLWPQNDTDQPAFCAGGGKGFVPEAVLRAMLDIMPARSLVIHQYRKHGTCSGLSAEAYFGIARRLYEAITIPARYIAPRDYQTLTPRQIEADFVAANEGIESGAVTVACGRGRRLREVRICFSRDLKPTACGRTGDRARRCRLARVILPPVRGGGARRAR